MDIITYVGLDVHKATISVALAGAAGAARCRALQPPPWRTPRPRAAEPHRHHRRFLDHAERNAFVADYNRTRLRCLDYQAPAAPFFRTVLGL